METDEQLRTRGQLTILLGYAAGVGKTYRMLHLAQEARRQGRDVVAGYFEPHGRADTIRKAESLEMAPRRRIEYRGRMFEEMDVNAILARRPELCCVDEFPHTNIPGSARAKRWEDVMVLLDAGIGVITTMNIQHLESLNDQVREIAGVQVRETIPDWVVERADEVIVVDLPPGALLNRLQRGVIYSRDKAEQAMANFFKESTLSALREMALRQAAHEVDLRQTNPPALAPAQSEDEPPERILIHINERPATAGLIRRAKRVAGYLKADCFAVCVLPPGGMAAIPSAAHEALERHLDFARKSRIETCILEGENAAETLVEFARRNGVTQIFLAKPARQPLSWIRKDDFVMQVVRLAGDRQVTIVAPRR